MDEKSIRMWFAAELKDRMEEADLKPYQMGYLCQFNHASIYNYLQGDSFPNPWSLVLMAEYLDCTVNDLLGYEEIDDVEVYERIKASESCRDKNQFAVRFAHRLKHYLESHAITLEELSNCTEFNTNTIRRWMSDRPSLPRTSDLLQICSALDCTPSELLGY